MKSAAVAWPNPRLDVLGDACATAFSSNRSVEFFLFIAFPPGRDEDHAEEKFMIYLAVRRERTNRQLTTDAQEGSRDGLQAVAT